ncbi:methyl-accepting chemotaxis protein [Herbaspirillum sp. WGmk3]|uniref:Methyl-accepting chemotaxis protein n=1 Tax=Herbaspirillum huttiense subsp. lycopersici TaxID=3074428 RepID=A0ABU2EN50_9BURK|nr:MULTISPECIES: methyl-accepting chemotaxis protein [Herbaspirillum]MBP1317293.1 methyl-accepting chemotaxis protein [Herbaspirillum sp. 1130]MCO4857765.1 methyl-accepting chemotaxis protein [Herbaspirillum sp. WGmk3]MDR9849187.1 methyl-accepting chemotaxis protein [Herbaspirillum huttiense SE1]
MLNSIKARILFYTIALLVASLAVVGTVSFFIIQTDNDRAIERNAQAVATGFGSTINEWVAARTAMTVAAAEGVQGADPVFVIKLLQKSGGFYVTTLGREDKTAFTSAAEGLPAGYDPTARPWYKQAVAAGKPVLTKPYTDVATKKPMVSFTAPVMQNGQRVGVVAAAMFLDGVSEVVRAIHPTPASYAFLVDRDGLMLAHPDGQWVNKPAKEWNAELTPERLQSLAADDKVSALPLDGAAKLIKGIPIKGTEWTLMLAMDKADVTAGMRNATRSALIALVLVALVAAGIMSVITTAVFQRLSRVRRAMDSLSSGNGDLTLRLDEDGKDELTQISRSFNQFVNQITGILQDVRRSSDTVKISSTEIASGNQDLSARTEQQAGALEETASAMEQLTSTVQQNSESARRANELAGNASRIAAQGGEVVGNVVSTMEAINASSRQIADIITVIDGIAFQTNILALNAAVEAARAGEQGRGFAVVASEVRSLAQRSAQAAKEIKQLIDNSVAKVADGGVLVAQAGQTMEQIVASIRDVSVIVSEIAHASSEQNGGIQEVNLAITHIDEGTQQNAALVEQAAAAAKSLQDEAHRLSVLVGGFKM